jgi:hypothetical protein
MIFVEMCIKTYNYYTVLLINNNTKVFKKVDYPVAVANCKLLELLIGVCNIACTIAYIIYLLGCYCLAVLYKLYYVETLTLLTLTALYFAKFIDETLSIAVKSI